MNNLANTLGMLSRERKLTQVDVSRRSGIPQSQISRWISGAQRSITDGHLQALSERVFTRRMDRARILKARMLDVCTGPAAGHVDVVINIGPEDDGKGDAKPSQKLPTKVEESFATLRTACATDPELRAIIQSLARRFKQSKHQAHKS